MAKARGSTVTRRSMGYDENLNNEGDLYYRGGFA